MTTDTNPCPASPYPATLSGQTLADIEKKYQAAHDPKRAAQSEDTIIIGAWLSAVLNAGTLRL
jgi:hypothetical protein